VVVAFCAIATPFCERNLFMKITINEFDNKLNEYVKTKLLPSFKNPLYIFITSGMASIDAISVMPHLDKLSMIGICENGTIDTDKLDTFMVAGFKAVPSINYVGLKFTIKDYENFKEVLND
jgi:hypothetical protein